MTATIYKTKAGETEILSIYDRAEARIGLPFEHRYIQTRFGTTQVLVTGPENAPPFWATLTAVASSC